MASTVVEAFTFLDNDRKNKGAIEVIKNEYQDRTVIGLRLRVGGRTVPLPRNKVGEIISAMQKAEASASRQYKQLIEEMNDVGSS